MNNRDEIWGEIAQKEFEKYELEIFFKLKESGAVHANRYNKIIRQMEAEGVPKAFADRFIQNQIYDMRLQIAEQAATC